MRMPPIGYRRAGTGALVACASLVVSNVAGASWSLTGLAAWDSAAATLLVATWVDVAIMSSEETGRSADREDAPHAAAEIAVLCAALASLVAIAFIVVDARHAEHIRRAALIGVAVVSVLLSWAAVHTVFMLRYARQYHDHPVGGIDFGAPPDYRDFAYLALTIGMTYQVSDTPVTDRAIRRTVLHHALLAYLFGTVILALTISSIASLLVG
jgi:uncharacterized membrane protein